MIMNDKPVRSLKINIVSCLMMLLLVETEENREKLFSFPAPLENMSRGLLRGFYWRFNPNNKIA